MAFKKTVYSKTKKIFIAGSGTFAMLFALLLTLSFYGVNVQTSGDQICSDTCVSYFNISLKDYSLCFGSTFKGVYTDPNVTIEIFKADSRYRSDNPNRWKPYNFTANKCLDRNKTYEFKLIGHKLPVQTVKWGLSLGGKDVDPFWFNSTGGATGGDNVSAIYMELGSRVNLTANTTLYNTNCVDIYHPSYNNSYKCGTPSANFLFNITFFRKDYFDNFIYTKNLTFTGNQNYSYNITVHKYDEFDSLSLNLSDYLVSSLYPSSIKIYVNNTLSNSLGTIISPGSQLLDTFNDTTTSKNFTFQYDESETRWFKLPVPVNVTSAKFNITGLSYNGSTQHDLGSIYHYKYVNYSGSGFISNSSFSNFVESGTLMGCGQNCNADSTLDFNVTFYTAPTQLNIKTSFWQMYFSGNMDNVTINISVYNFTSGAFVHVNSSVTIFSGGGGTCTQNQLAIPLTSDMIRQNTTMIKYRIWTWDPSPSSATWIASGCDGKSADTAGYFSNFGIWPTYATTFNSSNVRLEIGNIDGEYEWYEGAGKFVTKNTTNDLSAVINSYLDICTVDSNGYCAIPIQIQSNSPGIVNIDAINITYAYSLNPIILDYGLISSFINSTTTETAALPIKIEATNGLLNFDDIRFDYAGGNNTIALGVHNSTISYDITEAFNNSLANETMAFTDNETKTRYFNLSIDSRITSASMQFNGSVFNNNCYQEQANQSTAGDGNCTLYYTGVYSDDSGFPDAYKAHDGNYGTSASANESYFQYVYLNYTKPVGANATSSLYIQWGTPMNTWGASAAPHSSCWDYNSTMLFYRIGVKDTGTINTDCLNSTGWKNVQSGSGPNGAARIGEEQMRWYIPILIGLDIGDSDSVYEWDQTYAFNSTNQPSSAWDFSKRLNYIIDNNCKCASCSLSGKVCNIPFYFYSYSPGNLTYHGINITSYYAEKLNLINYYSSWDYAFPRASIQNIEFIPSSPTSKNVTPFGQLASTPIFNITMYNYGGKNANLSFSINETHSCVNLSISNQGNVNNRNYTGSNINAWKLNNTWQEIFTNLEYLNTASKVWMWADYSCNYTTWRQWQPNFDIKVYCVGCTYNE